MLAGVVGGGASEITRVIQRVGGGRADARDECVAGGALDGRLESGGHGYGEVRGRCFAGDVGIKVRIDGDPGTVVCLGATQESRVD